jgi:hypothetical protein
MNVSVGGTDGKGQGEAGTTEDGDVMGEDAIAYAKAKPGWKPPLDVRVSLATDSWDQRLAPGATHRISLGPRYFNLGSERGYWPEIAAKLIWMALDGDVEKLWYGSDHDKNELEVFDLDKIVEVSKLWVRELMYASWF